MLFTETDSINERSLLNDSAIGLEDALDVVDIDDGMVDGSLNETKGNSFVIKKNKQSKKKIHIPILLGW